MRDPRASTLDLTTGAASRLPVDRSIAVATPIIIADLLLLSCP